MFARLKSVFHDDLAASLVEYALILSLVAMTCVFGLKLIGTNANTPLTAANTAITDAAAGQTTGNGNADGNAP